ncbi:MAG: DUF6477 family protein [Paracoccaceae bacterium]
MIHISEQPNIPRRPRTLVRAARILAAWRAGQECEASETDFTACGSPDRLRRLIEAERHHEEVRLRNRFEYRVERHVEALADLLAGIGHKSGRPTRPA